MKKLILSASLVLALPVMAQSSMGTATDTSTMRTPSERSMDSKSSTSRTHSTTRKTTGHGTGSSTIDDRQMQEDTSVSPTETRRTKSTTTESYDE